MQPIKPERRQRGADDEPPETKDLTKKKLHERLSIDWFLPPNEARGVTRIYLVQVFRGQVFRVPLLEMQHFMADLHKDHMKKAPYINSLDAKIKVQALLRERNMPPLGYPDSVVPEEDWLFQVARKLDQNNSTAIFLKAIPNPAIGNNHSELMLRAKKNAERINILTPGYDKIPAFYSLLIEVWNAHKRATNKHREVQTLQWQLEQAMAKRDQEEVGLKAALNMAANDLYVRSTEDMQMERMYEDSQYGANMRFQVKEHYNV